MPSFRIRSFSAALLVVFALALPAAAQESAAKTAWNDLRSFARERGVLIASQGVTDYGGSLVAQNIRIYLEEDPEAVVIAMPEMRIEPRGPALALIPSPQFTITVHPDRRTEHVLTVSHGGEIVADVSDDRIALDLPLNQLAVTLARAVRAGVALPQTLDVSFAGLAGRIEILRTGRAEFRLGADTTRYSFAMSDPTARPPMQQTGEAEISGLQIEFTGDELDMLSDDSDALRQAFDAGFNLHFSLGAQSSTGSSEQNIGGNTISVTSVAGESRVGIDVAEGAISVESHAGVGRFSGGMAPFAGDVSFEAIGFSAGAPLLATADDQPLFYRFNFDTVVASPETLALVGAQDFGGEAITLAMDVSALGRLTRDVGPEFGEGDTPPLDITSVSLNQLLTRVGDAELTGSGAFAFLGGMLSSLGSDLPNGTGDFTFDLVGGDRLLTRLSALGIVPTDQQFFARMMMNGLGRSVGEDHLQSEVAIRPGGQITVNGAPLPF